MVMCIELILCLCLKMMLYRINFVFMPKNDALNLIKNAITIDKKEHYE